MKTTSTLAAALAAASLLLAGCASDVKLDTPVPVESRTTTGAGAGAGAGAGGGTTGGAGQSGVANVDLNRSGAGSSAAAQELPRVVYFDYDSFVVKDDARPVVEANARALTNDRTRRVQVEGHTDERGGREYNLALGQKRAEAVARAMTLLGAGENQIEAVSYGEERPAVTGNDEQAHARNRRAELNMR